MPPLELLVDDADALALTAVEEAIDDPDNDAAFVAAEAEADAAPDEPLLCAEPVCMDPVLALVEDDDGAPLLEDEEDVVDPVLAEEPGPPDDDAGLDTAEVDDEVVFGAASPLPRATHTRSTHSVPDRSLQSACV